MGSIIGVAQIVGTAINHVGIALISWPMLGLSARWKIVGAIGMAAAITALAPLFLPLPEWLGLLRFLLFIP